MAFGKRAKRVGKFVGRGAVMVAKAVRKRYVKKRQPRMVNIIKDLAMLKHLVNVEKKRFDFTLTTQNVAQFNSAATGAYCVQITPTPAEGITGSTRIGLSVKLVSACIDIKFSQQASALNDIKYRWFILCRKDSSVAITTTAFRDNFLEVNPFTGVIDYWSNRDPEYFGQVQVIKTGVVNLKQDGITGGNSIQQIKCPLKLNHHLKYNTDLSTTTTKNAFYLLVVASGGDSAASTGGILDYNARWYYTDN